MRPKGTRKQFCQRLTAKEIAKLRRWNKQGRKQTEVALALGCTVSTIQRQEKRLGITRRRPLDAAAEKQVAKLLESQGVRKVAKETGISSERVTRVMHERGITHKIGAQYLSPEKREALIKAIKSRKNFCVRIAKEVGVGTETARRYAHKILGPGKFLNTWPPLQSAEPQKHYPTIFAPDPFVLALENYFDRFHGGKLTPKENDAALVAAFLSYIPATAPEFIYDDCAIGFVRGLDVLRRQKNLQWTN